MLKLLATAPEDGWAFVQRDTEILWVRPPYRRWDLSLVPEATVEKAIQDHGFVAMEEAFPNWEEFITFLERQLVESRKALGQALPDSQSIRELMRYAPPRILAGYLDRVESELLPDGEWTAAQELLTLLLRLETVKNDAPLFDRTLDLLEKCQDLRDQAENRRRELIDEAEDLAQRFPNATRRHPAASIMEVIRQVGERRQIFAFEPA